MHLMLDLETLGVRAGCVVLSLGCCVVRGEKTLPTFYTTFSTAECLRLGMHVSDSTMKWWAKQPPEAASILAECARPDAQSVAGGLSSFYDYLLHTLQADLQTLHMWANGAAFDFPILRELYRRAEFEPPWHFRNERCFRTLSAHLNLPKPRPAVAHNALEDAIAQSVILATYCRSLR